MLADVGERADPVGVVHGLARRRAHLADDQPALVLRRHVQQQVGEAEVGEHAPLRRQAVEVRHLVAVERGVVADERGERGHRCRVCPIERQLAQVIRRAPQAGEVVDVGSSDGTSSTWGASAASSARRSASRVATRATSWNRVATSVSTSHDALVDGVDRRRPARGDGADERVVVLGRVGRAAWRWSPRRGA